MPTLPSLQLDRPAAGGRRRGEVNPRSPRISSEILGEKRRPGLSRGASGASGDSSGASTGGAAAGGRAVSSKDLDDLDDTSPGSPRAAIAMRKPKAFWELKAHPDPNPDPAPAPDPDH